MIKDIKSQQYKNQRDNGLVFSRKLFAFTLKFHFLAFYEVSHNLGKLNSHECKDNELKYPQNLKK